MSRLSIEVSEHQHQKIKALAALNGHTIREYILERTLPPETDSNEEMTEAQALSKLEAFLSPRIKAAKKGQLSKLSMDKIIAKAKSQRRR
jgi:hypothetical protein